MAKAKVSVTVDRSLLQKCDRVALGATRSEVFEQALQRWLRMPGIGWRMTCS